MPFSSMSATIAAALALLPAWFGAAHDKRALRSRLLRGITFANDEHLIPVIDPARNFGLIPGFQPHLDDTRNRLTFRTRHHDLPLARRRRLQGRFGQEDRK